MGLGGFLPGILCLLSTVIFIKTFVDFIGGTTFLFGSRRLQLSPIIPPLIQSGSEWRFQNTPTEIGNCSYFSAFGNRSLEEVNRGFNKVVFRQNEEVVIKKIAFNGPSFLDCTENADGDLNEEYRCVEAAATGFITEIGILLKLQSDASVPKLLAYCIPEDFVLHADVLSSATIAGKPLDIIHLAQSDWSERVRILDEVIQFLDRSRPLLFRDFRRQQFVIIKNRPSMVDFDDVIATSNSTEHEHLVGRIYSSFIDGILFATNPPEAREPLAEIKEAYKNSTLTLKKLSKIVEQLRTL